MFSIQQPSVKLPLDPKLSAVGQLVTIFGYGPAEFYILENISVIVHLNDLRVSSCPYAYGVNNTRFHRYNGSPSLRWFSTYKVSCLELYSGPSLENITVFYPDQPRAYHPFSGLYIRAPRSITLSMLSLPRLKNVTLNLDYPVAHNYLDNLHSIVHLTIIINFAPPSKEALKSLVHPATGIWLMYEGDTLKIVKENTMWTMVDYDPSAKGTLPIFMSHRVKSANVFNENVLYRSLSLARARCDS